MIIKYSENKGRKSPKSALIKIRFSNHCHLYEFFFFKGNENIKKCISKTKTILSFIDR